jgi:hypothetical protein
LPHYWKRWQRRGAQIRDREDPHGPVNVSRAICADADGNQVLRHDVANDLDAIGYALHRLADAREHSDWRQVAQAAAVIDKEFRKIKTRLSQEG